MLEPARPIRVLTLDHPNRFGAIAHGLKKRIKVMDVLKAAHVAEAIAILNREQLDVAVIYVRDHLTQVLANEIAKRGVRLVVTTGKSPGSLSGAIPGAVAIFKTPPLDYDNLTKAVLGKITVADEATGAIEDGYEVDA